MAESFGMDVFKPTADCSVDELESAATLGLDWMRALFVGLGAINQSPIRDDSACVDLANIGQEIASAVHAKVSALIKLPRVKA